jgi:hypothetical protein
MAELAKMYPPQANTPETSLSGALPAAGTTVNVVDGTILPDAPNLLTIGADGSTAETVLMTAKNGNVLTVVRGQDGTTARAWSAGWAFTGTTTFPSRWRPEWRLTTWVARYA